ncbi:MAG TPA: hypothetical protein VG100_04695, partial [Xanthobacteraceae bacterium]|nr:hypothetical protein [Xanthobacteraceae bacterium]
DIAAAYADSINLWLVMPRESGASSNRERCIRCEPSSVTGSSACADDDTGEVSDTYRSHHRVGHQ